MDYFSPDGNHKEPKTIMCPECVEGLIDDKYICDKCEGTGEIELTDEEAEFEKECRKDDEADKMRD
jgi:hypothetical protein